MYIHDTDRVQQVGGEVYVEQMYMGEMFSNKADKVCACGWASPTRIKEGLGGQITLGSMDSNWSGGMHSIIRIMQHAA